MDIKVSSKANNNWIFLPTTGYHNGTSSNDVGSYGYYHYYVRSDRPVSE